MEKDKIKIGLKESAKNYSMDCKVYLLWKKNAACVYIEIKVAQNSIHPELEAFTLTSRPIGLNYS